MRNLSRLLFVLLTGMSLAAPATACTTFCLRGGDRVVFGRNYDWSFADGMLVVNQRGVARTADIPSRPASWVSRYGSVSFDQYGRDFPTGGMNEAGLVIELMWLDGVHYPEPDARPAVDVLQWIQYNLDNHATVDEVLGSDRTIRIESRTPLHYLVADRRGQVATVEFVKGRLVAHTGKDLPVAALTNNFYDESLRFRNGHKAVSEGVSSLARFSRAAERVQGFDPKKGDPVAYAFETLDRVAQPGQTQWSVVYEIDRGRVHFRTRDHRQIKTVSLADLDFGCGGPVKVLDLNTDLQGNVAKNLVPYTREQNRRLVTASFHKTPFLADVPGAELERLARYPESDTCRR